MPDGSGLTLQALVDAMSPSLAVTVPGPPGALDREVLWLHNTELPDPSPYVRGTEVVLTNGLWRESIDAVSFVGALVSARASGLIFGLTAEVPNVPDDVEAACRNADLPLLTLATSVPFTAVTETAARIQSDARQGALAGLVRRGNALATAIARGAGAEGVLEVLRRDHDLPLLVVDRMGRRLAGDAAPGSADAEVNRVAAEALARHPPPLEADLPGLGPSALFLVDGAMGEVDAAVFCLRPLRSISATERDAVEQAARFLSLEVTKQQAMQAIESRFSSELLEMILSGAARAEEVAERLRAFGIDPSGQLAVLAIVVGDDRLRPAGSTDEIEDFFGRLGIPAVTVPGSRDTVVVMPWSGDVDGLVELARNLIDAVTSRLPGDRMVVGVGEPAADSTGLREPLIRSREVCRVLRRRSSDSRVGTFADVGTHRMLLGLHDRGLLRRFADDVLAPLREHDEQSGTELERTLRVFLANDGQWSTTATELFVHVNTLRNRIARIGELTGRDVARLEDRVDLFLAVEADALG
jgi:PucR family transcriptional regulator, purine catabolism regulatory protein